jgi:SAM-dependent methyltransferase
VLKPYYQKVHMRVKEFLAPQGTYFLDAGSGAISHAEYLTYSAGYHRRICVDLSIKALVEARGKLQEHGCYVIADLTKLPFRDGTFDAAISAHVLYHIPEDEQASALRELYRTLKPGRQCVVIYVWPTSLPTKLASLFSSQQIIAKTRRLIAMIPGERRLGRQQAPPTTSEREPGARECVPPLYFHAHNYQWFRDTVPDEWETEIRCWRFVNRPFTTTFVANNVIGRLLLAIIFWLETLFPHAMARIGSYPMIILRK